MENLKITSLAEADAAYEQLKLSRKKNAAEPEIPVGKGLRKDYLGSRLEREAVQHAIRTRHGVNPLPGKIDHYVQTIGAIAHAHGAKLPGAKAYADHINGFSDNALSQAAIEGASKKLIDSGLLGLSDRALSNRKGHTPLPEPLAAPTTAKPSGFVELPEALRAHEPTPAEVARAIDTDLPGKIKPATGETVKPAAMTPAAKRARSEEATAGETPVPAEDAPLPLASSPEDGKGVRNKDRYRRISDLVLAQKKPADIVRAIATEFGLSTRSAADTVRRWHDARAIGLHAHGDPTKLARKTGTKVGDLVKGVYGHIAGTRLANHLHNLYTQFFAKPPKREKVLSVAKDKSSYEVDNSHNFSPEVLKDSPELGRLRIQMPEGYEYDPKARPAVGDAEIATLAKSILTRGPKANQGKGINGGDVFAKLGKMLEANGHPLAKTYNWSKMGETLRLDDKVRQFVEKHIPRPDGMSEHEYWSKVVSQYAREAANPDASKRREKWDEAAKSAHSAAHNEFWKRALGSFDEKELGKVNDSLYRHHALAEDRADTELDTAHGDNAGALANLKGTWAGNKALKFQRDELPTLAILATLNPEVRRQLTERGAKFAV